MFLYQYNRDKKREEKAGRSKYIKKEVEGSDPAKDKRAARRIKEDRPMGAFEKGAVPL